MSRKIVHPVYGVVRVLEMRGFIYRCREIGGSNEYLIGLRELARLQKQESEEIASLPTVCEKLKFK